MLKFLTNSSDTAIGRITAFSGICTSLVAITALAGWISGVRVLTSFHSDYIPMAIDTSLLLIIMGVILLSHSLYQKIWYKRIITGIVCFISFYGLLKFIEYLSDMNLTFENFLFPVTEKLGNYLLTRMSPFTGLFFLLSGTALILKFYGKEKLQVLNYIGFIGILIFFGSFTSILGYLLGTPILYGSETIPIAATTSLAFLFIGAGIVSLSGAKSIFLRHFAGDSASSRILRFILPVIFIALLIDNVFYNSATKIFDVNFAAVCAVSSLVIIILVIIFVIKISKIVFQKAESEEIKRRQAESALKEANEKLEQRVIERTEELQRSEERLKGIFQSSPDGLLVTDTKGNVIDCNDMLLKIMDFKLKDDLLGTNVFAYIIDEDRKKANDNWEIVFEKGIHKDSEYTLVSSEGRKFPANVSSSLMKNNSGKILGLVIVVKDITGQKEAENRIKHLASFPNRNPNPILEIDENGNILFANDSSLKILESLNVPLKTNLFLPDDFESILKYLKDRIQRVFTREVIIQNFTFFEVITILPELEVIRIYGLDITERKKMEVELKNNQKKLIDTYSSMTDGLILHDIVYDDSGKPVDYIINEVNPAFEKITGMKASESIGKKASVLYGTGEAPYLDVYAKVALGGEPESFEVYFPPMEKHFAISVFSPELGKFATVFQDISERKRNEFELLRAHERLELAQQSSGAGIWDWDIITGKLDWSSQLMKIFGLDPLKTEASFDMWRKILYSEDAQNAEMKIELAVKNHEPLENEYRIVHPNGEIRCISVLGNTVYDNNGNPVRMSGICIDISEKKKIENMIMENEKRIKIAETVQTEKQRFLDVLETLPVYVILLTADYHVPYANHFFRERFGESNGHRCYEYLFNRNEPCEICDTYKTLKENKPQRWEWTGPDGRNYDIYDFPFTDSDGTTLIMEMGMDITERKKAETELKRINRALRTISSCNQVLIHSETEKELLTNVCKVIVEEGTFRFAWVGYTENDSLKSVKPVGYAGFEDGYIERLHISWGDNDYGKGPTGTAIRTGKTTVCKNIMTDPNFAPWRDEASKRGYASSIVIPLISKGVTFGALSIYASEPDAFDGKEIELLSELSDDLTYGILAIRDNIERHKAEEMIKAQAERYSAILATSRDGFWRTDTEGKLLDVNDAYCQMSGYTRDELLSLQISDLEASEKPDDIKQHINKIIENKFDRFETKHRKKNGEILDVEISVAYWKTAEQFLLFVRDISEYKKTREALVKSEKEIRTLFELLPVGVSVIDEKRNILKSNPAFEKVIKMTADDISKNLHLKRKYIRNDGTPITIEDFPSTKALIEQFTVFNDEMGIIQENGEKFWLSVSAAPLTDSSAVIVSADITERKISDKIIKESEARLNEAQHIGHIGSWELDIINNKLIWSDEIFKIFEIDPEKFESSFESFLDAIHPDDRDYVEKEYANSVKNHTEYDIEHRLLFKDGRIKYVHERCLTYYDENGIPLRSLGTVQDITEHKEAEKNLIKLNEEILDLYNNAPCGYHSLDKDGYFTRINDTELKWLGYERDEVIGKLKFTDIITPESVRVFNQNFPVFKEKGFVNFLQFEHVRKDGSTFYVEINATSVNDEQGEFKISRSTSFDITERILAERKLQQAQTNWKETFNAISDRICLLSKDGTIIQCNDSMIKSLESQDKNVIGKKCYEVMHSTKKFFHNCPYANVRQSLKRETTEQNINGKYFSITVDPILNENKEVLGAVHIMRDITARKQFENALRQSEERFSKAFHASPAAVSLINVKDRRLTDVNLSFLKLFEYEREEVLGKTLNELDLFDINNKSNKSPDIFNGPPFVNNYELKARTKSGKSLILLITTEGIKVAGDNQILATMIDITELKLFDEQLRELSNHMEKIREDERISLSRILHDNFGQSLTGIKMGITSLERKLSKIINLEKIPEITDNISSMKTMLNDTAALTSRISMELRPDVLDRFGLKSAIDWLAEDFSKKSEIKCKFKSEFEDIKLNPDNATGIFRILQEALTNVIRHAKATEVDIKLYRENDKYFIDVIDNGVGISPEKISSPYSFGLLGMKERSLLFEGNLIISNAKEKGTKITIEIPAKEN